MKKLIFSIITFCFLILPIKALEEIPSNIYYLDNDIYAYLRKNDIDSTSKIYVEYRLTKGEETKNLELIELTKTPLKSLILKADDEFFSKDILIESRFVLYDEEYTYGDWSEKEKITEFDFSDIPTPKISNLNSNLEYVLDNQEEIDKYFEEYIKINELKTTYKVEYRVNDEDWKEEKPSAFDPEDVKIEIRIKYEVGEYKSLYSNTLLYEKHPEKTCPFGSDICCNEIMNFSLCYWILIFVVLLILLLIYIDNRRRLKREA